MNLFRLERGVTMKKNTAYYIHSAIVLALMFGFGFLPPFGQITEMGMRVLGVFAGMLWGWIFIEVTWPSILGMIAFGLTGFMTVPQVFAAGFGNTNVLTVLMAFLFTALLESCKITDYIAAKFLSSKAIIGKPWLLITMIFLADYVISILSSNLAATFLLWAMFIKVAEMVGYEKGDKLVSFVICGIVYIGVCAAMVLPFRTAAIVFVGFLTNGTGLTVEYIPYTVYMLITSMVVLFMLLFIGKYILRLDVSKLADDEDRFAYMRGKKATYEQKIGLCFIAVFLLTLFLPSFMPKEWMITQVLSNWGLVGVVGVLLVVATLIRSKEGQSFISIEAVCSKGIGWELIWLLVATFPLADAMKSQDCGIIATVVAAITPYLQNMQPTVFMILCMVILGITTQFVHNIVLAAMFIPLMTTLCAEMGGNPITMFFVCYWALQAAFSTPGASMQGAMMHGHAWVGNKDGYLFGAIYLFMTFVVMIVIGIPLGSLLF